MLYVFLVNSGTMLALDMQLALGSVDALKRHIGQRCPDLPVDKQVLLISGGEWLDGAARVGSFPAGTDTSPIFLFSKAALDTGGGGGGGGETSVPYSRAGLSTDVLGDECVEGYDSVEAQVTGALALPSSYSTVVSRSQLAQQLYERGKQQLELCERLIRDQHMQQQGWAAVVANMDDLTQSLQHSHQRFRQMFEQYLDERPRHLQLIETFHADVQLLARVPLLTELQLRGGEGDLMPAGSSLLDWISAQDTRRLEDVCERTQQGLETLDREFLQQVRAETEQLLNPSRCAELAEIGGLEGRLQRLDELHHAGQQLLHEQQELARAFVQNQNRASCVNDPSVLPDLCQSHCTQLQVMLAKHRRLLDTRARCSRAKDELSANIGARLGWVIAVQRRMTELCGRLVIYSERLKQLRQQAAVLAALHTAPRVYCRAAGEVVRRRAFSGRFLAWAGQVAAAASAAVAAEVRARRRFTDLVGVHFLSGVFAGLAAAPPPFAAQCPADFDDQLPPLTAADLRQLQLAVPELADLLAPGLEAADPGLPALPAIASAAVSSAAAPRVTRHCCLQLLQTVRTELDQLRCQLKQLVQLSAQQLADQRRKAAAVLEQLVARCRRLQLAATEASTCAALAEARAEECSALLAESQRRCCELEPVTAAAGEHHQLQQQQLQAALEQQRTRLHAEWQLAEADRTERQLQLLRQQLTAEREQLLQAAGDKLRAEHRAEMLALRSRFRNLTSQLSTSQHLPATTTAMVGDDPLPPDQNIPPLSPTLPIHPPAQQQQQKQSVSAAGGCCHQLSVHSCADGDVVLAVWDVAYGHYRVFQHTAPATNPGTATSGGVLYFVHGDSYAALGLSVAGGAGGATAGQPPCVLGRVVSHEFCQAKKDGNRYRVPRGTRFYRVRLQPCPPPATLTVPALPATATTATQSSSDVATASSHQSASFVSTTVATTTTAATAQSATAGTTQ